MKVFAADALVVPTGILAAAFLTRSLGPERYGLFTVAASIVLWVETAATLLLSRAAVKFVAEADDWPAVAARLNRVQVAVSLAAAGTLAAAAPIIAAWLRAPALAPVLQLFALDVPIFALAALHRAFLIGRGAFERVVVPAAARWLVRLALVFLLVGLGWSLAGAVLATVGGSLVALLVTRFSIRPPLWGRTAAPIHRMWEYALPLFLSAMATQAFTRLDLLMVKALVDRPSAAGFYGAAQNMSIGPGLLAAAFSPLLLGTLSGLTRDGRDPDFQPMIRQVFRLLLGLLPFVGIAAPAASDLAALVYGREFAQAGPAAALLFVAGAALFVVSVTTAILTALGEPAIVLTLAAPLVPVALAAHLLVIPRWGLVGAASVTAILSTMAAAAGTLIVADRTEVPLPLPTWLRVALVAAAGYGLASAWRMPGVLVLVELPVLAICALVALRYAGVITPADVRFARSLMSRRADGARGST